MRANAGFLDGLTLVNWINMNALILTSFSCLLFRTKHIPLITSRNAVSPFKAMVVDFDHLARDYLL